MQRKNDIKIWLLRIGAVVLIAGIVFALILIGDRPLAQTGGELSSQAVEPTPTPVPTMTPQEKDAQLAFTEDFIESDTQKTDDGICTGLDSSLSTQYMVLYDATHKRILYSKNADHLCYPASTTKILTACVAAKICAPDTIFTVGDELSLVAYDSSVANLRRGQQIDFLTLLDALMLPSGNDAAYVMAAGVGRLYAGDDSLCAEDAVAVFCDLMNATAQRLGATNSHFVNPDGYHDWDHYTTAMDMMKIALYATSIETVRNAYGKQERSCTFQNGEEYHWTNSNPLIDPSSSYYYPYATGIKTGFTDQAGSCLVAAAEKDGVKLIAVAMYGYSIASRNTDLICLLNAGFSLYD